jgi:hypothetical protein
MERKKSTTLCIIISAVLVTVIVMAGIGTYVDLKFPRSEIVQTPIEVKEPEKLPDVEISTGHAVINFNDPEINTLADCIIKLQPKTTPFVAKYIAANIIKESTLKSLDSDLVASQIWVESEFNPNATSSKGARGLMQVRYEVWKDSPLLKDNGVDVKHKIYWIDANIQCGTDILAKFIKEANGDIPIALNRYWTGSPKMEKKPWENEYVAKILYYYFKIREHKLHGTPLEAEEIAAAPIPELPATAAKPAAVKK